MEISWNFDWRPFRGGYTFFHNSIVNQRRRGAGVVKRGGFLGRLDRFVERPDALRNCFTVDTLMPKFTSSGGESVTFANFVCSVETPQLQRYSHFHRR